MINSHATARRNLVQKRRFILSFARTVYCRPQISLRHEMVVTNHKRLACEEADITVTLPKPMTSNNMAGGRFVKADFRYVAAKNVYICPAGERLPDRYTNEEKGLTLRRYLDHRLSELRHQAALHRGSGAAGYRLGPRTSPGGSPATARRAP